MPSKVNLAGYGAGDAHADKMIQIYRATQRRLEVLAMETLTSGALGSTEYYDRQKRMVKLILSQLQVDQQASIYNGINEIYKATGHAAFNAGNMGLQFGGVNQQAVRVLASAMNAKIVNALTLIGRRVDDAFRDAALKEVAAGVAGGLSRRQVSSALQERILKKGITDATTGFVDKAGRRWSLEAYTRMVARTTTREAMTSAVVDQMQQAGSDLITISEHPTEADICTEYAGKTWSLNGLTPGYEQIDQLPPFHPNCIHIVLPAEANFDEFEKQLQEGLEDPSSIPQGANETPSPAKIKTSKTSSKSIESQTDKLAAKASKAQELEANDAALWKVSKLSTPPKTTYGTGGTGAYRDFHLTKGEAMKSTSSGPFGDGPAIYDQRLPANARIAEFNAYDWPINPTTGAKMTQDELVTAVKRSGYDGFRVNTKDGGRIHLWRKTSTTKGKAPGEPLFDQHKFTGGRPKIVNPSPEIKAIKPAPKLVKPKPKVVKSKPVTYKPPKLDPELEKMGKAIDDYKGKHGGTLPDAGQIQHYKDTGSFGIPNYKKPKAPGKVSEVKPQLIENLEKYIKQFGDMPDDDTIIAFWGHLDDKLDPKALKAAYKKKHPVTATPKPKLTNPIDIEKYIDDYIEQNDSLPTMKMVKAQGIDKPKNALQAFKTKYPERVKGLKTAKNPKVKPSKHDVSTGAKRPHPSELPEGNSVANNSYGGATEKVLGQKSYRVIKHLENEMKNGHLYKAIRNYTSGGYQNINPWLRKLAAKKARPGTGGVNELHSTLLDGLFKKMPANNYKATLYRSAGVKHNGEYAASVKDLRVGAIHVEDGYVSTSYRKQMAWDWKRYSDAPDIWEIEAPPGWKGMNVEDTRTSSNLGEDEIILPRGYRFQIMDIQYVEKSGKTWRYIRARLIP
jgi:hypothetical protein